MIWINRLGWSQQEVRVSVTLLVGTTKGAFLVSSDAGRASWTVSGPHCELWPINHVVGDARTGAIWAAGGGDWNGAGVWRSEDGGESWTLSALAHGQAEEFMASSPEVAEMFGWTTSPPAPFTGEIGALWSLGLAGETLYAGAKPAMLFASHDPAEREIAQEFSLDEDDTEAAMAGG